MKKRIGLLVSCFFVVIMMIVVRYEPVLAYDDDEEEDPYIEQIVAEPDRIYYDDEPKETTVKITCSDEVRDRLRYQWCYEEYVGEDEDEDVVRVELEGQNQPSFTPTKEMLEKSNWFFCRVTVEGDDTYVNSTWVEYCKSDDVQDLTEQEYDDQVPEMLGEDRYFCIRHIKGAAETKGMRITFKDFFYGRIIDGEGHSFYVDMEENDKDELEIKGNEFYVYSYVFSQKELGIASIEERDTFIPKVIGLETMRYPDKNTYQPGERLDLTGFLVCRNYNDGTQEIIPETELLWDKDKILTVSDWRIEVTDSVTQLTISVYVYVDYDLGVSMTVRPKEIFLSEEVQHAAVEAKNAMDEMKYLWVLYNDKGDVAAELDDDMEPSVTLPANLPTGRYRLQCYYYTEETGFQRELCVTSSFYVAGPELFKESAELPESTHRFSSLQNPTVKGFVYRKEGADSLSVTFDERTSFEEYGDQFIVYDGNGKETSYKTNELAGKTIEVQGDTLKVLMRIQPFSSAWGFAVTNIEVHGGKKEPEPTQTPQTLQTPQPSPSASPSPTPVTPKKITVGTSRVKKVKVKKKTATVTIQKVKGAKGYQIQYSRTGKGKKFTKSKLTSKTSCPLKKLKKGTYRIKVRAYKLDGKGKKVYGKWSKAKKVMV